jgi:8-oxo-dGTP pyrophosphatase MutT (NUDIX family)
MTKLFYQQLKMGLDLSELDFDKDREKGMRPVVVGLLIFDKKVLFVYKKEYDLWQFPQGGIRNEEDLKAAFKREMKEEMGWEIETDDLEVIGEERLAFPSRLHGSRKLEKNNGEEVEMIGKKYYFAACQLNEKSEFNKEKSEFDEVAWCDFERAKETAAKIYQKNKQRLILEAVEELKNKDLID